MPAPHELPAAYWMRDTVNRKQAGISLVVAALAALAAGCSAAPAWHDPAGSRVTTRPALPAGGPLPAATMRRLPAGVFYLLAGPTLPSLNVWEVTAATGARQLTHNPLGYGISSFAASAAGIILADARHGIDNLARWRTNGAVWLHPAGQPQALIHGESPDISDAGDIAYETPPSPGHSDFRNWVQRGFRGHPRVVYRHRFDIGGPVFGPHGQIVLSGPTGPWLSGHKPRVVILSSGGKPHTLKTGFAELGYPIAWAPHAPALAMASWQHVGKVFYPGGRQALLPPGWQPLTWNTRGTQLLMRSRSQLGTWSPQQPHKVTVIGGINQRYLLIQVSWLSKQAPM
jgi:hypothetical protein